MPALKIFHKKTFKYNVWVFTLLSSLSFRTLTAQNTYIPLNGYTYHIVDRINIGDDSTRTILHTAVKPYSYIQLRELNSGFYGKTDSLHSKREDFNINYLLDENAEIHDEHKAIWNTFYEQRAALFSAEEQYFRVYINPVIYAEAGSSSDTAGLKFINTRGIEIRGDIDRKVGFYFYATDNQARFPAYVNDRIIMNNNVVPGEGRAKIFKTTGYDYLDAQGYIGFNVTRHIAVQFGRDKIFIGDGIRSLIWSDNASDFLFLKLNARVWKINYQNVFAEMANFNNGYLYDSLIQKKYAAIHHLSLNLTRKLNIGLFESVVFDRYDSTGHNAGFELNYLNPIIFYRAIESGLGSPDNVLLGANWKWNFRLIFSGVSPKAARR